MDKSIKNKNPNQKVRNGKVDFYKFLFSLVVITFHFSNAIDYKADTLFSKGYIAVEFFFITSGFLFAKSLSKIEYKPDTLASDSIRFMGKKYKSFLPYHFFTVVLTLIYCIFHFDWSLATFCKKLVIFLPDCFLIQMGGLRRFDQLGHEWYLSAMLIVMFVLTPIAIKYRKQFLYYIAPISALLSLGYLNNTLDSINTTTAWSGHFYTGLIRAFAEISLGCVCYAVYESKLLEKLNKVFLLLLELGIYIITLAYANNDIDAAFEYGLVLLLALAVTISFTEKTSLKIFNNKFVLFLGKLSFPVYLNQIWLRGIIAKLDWDYGYIPHLIFYTVCLIIVSLLCILIMDNLIKLFDRLSKKKA